MRRLGSLGLGDVPICFTQFIRAGIDPRTAHPTEQDPNGQITATTLMGYATQSKLWDIYTTPRCLTEE